MKILKSTLQASRFIQGSTPASPIRNITSTETGGARKTESSTPVDHLVERQMQARIRQIVGLQPTKQNDTDELPDAPYKNTRHVATTQKTNVYATSRPCFSATS
jgi:hypothetical protein